MQFSDASPHVVPQKLLCAWTTTVGTKLVLWRIAMNINLLLLQLLIIDVCRFLLPRILLLNGATFFALLHVILCLCSRDGDSKVYPFIVY